MRLQKDVTFGIVALKEDLRLWNLGNYAMDASYVGLFLENYGIVCDPSFRSNPLLQMNLAITTYY